MLVTFEQDAQELKTYIEALVMARDSHLIEPKEATALAANAFGIKQDK